MPISHYFENKTGVKCCFCLCPPTSWPERLLLDVMSITPCGGSEREFGPDLDAVDERCEQEDEQLHRGHALVEHLGALVLLLRQERGAAPGARAAQGRAGHGAGGSRGGTLVGLGLEVPAAAAAAPGPALAQARALARTRARVVVALLVRLQEHPVQSVEQLGLGHTELVLVA